MEGEIELGTGGESVGGWGCEGLGEARKRGGGGLVAERFEASTTLGLAAFQASRASTGPTLPSLTASSLF